VRLYRGTPLWQEYVNCGILDDDRDWDQSFKCCDIDPDTVPNDEVNRLRMKGYVTLLLHRIVRRPLQTWNLLRTFSRHMALSDLLALISGPFRRKASSGVLPARMVDAGTKEPVRLASWAAAAARGLHGGTITARSDDAGRGTELVVSLPLLPQQEQSPAPPPGRAPAAEGPASRPASR
jgi:hypothetical protein